MSAAALRTTTTRRLLLFPRLRRLSTQPNPDPKPNPNTNPKPLTLLRTAIKSESDPDRIADLFQSSTHLPRFHSDRPLYQLTLHKLARLRRPDLIHRILHSLASDPLSPKSEGFFTRILTLYSSSNLLDHALQLFHQIPSKTQLSFSALLSVLYKHNKYDLIIENFNTLPKELGIEVGIVPYNIYMKALCGNGRVEDARKVLDEMAEPEPDVVSYNAVLNGYLKKGDEVGFQEILKVISDKGLEPNVFTYNCRISMFCRKSQSFRAEELLDVMAGKGLKPNLMSFNTIIDGFCEEGDVGSAVRVFKRMRVMKRVRGKDGVSPDGNSYVALIRSLVEKGQFDSGLEICKECLIRKFAPPFEVVKLLIEGLVRNDMVEEAKGVAEKMNSVVKGEAVDAWKKMESTLALQRMEGWVGRKMSTMVEV